MDILLPYIRSSDIFLYGVGIILAESKVVGNKIQQSVVTENLTLTDNGSESDKETRVVIAHDVVRIRGATGEDHPPIIVSIPRPILNVVKMEKGDEARIYTDGVRIYLEKLEEPTL